MLLQLVIAYLVLSVAIGLFAATRVHNTRDYITAGRNLPMPVVLAMVFATWFGAETVLGISATFLEEGFRGLISDPLGASLCLVLFGLVFARPLYRMNLLTLGDFFRVRYNRSIELVLSLCIVISYLGWVAAQVTALGLVFNVLSEDTISMNQGMLIGAGVVLVYTLFGGMWSVAMTTFVQMIVIVIGLLLVSANAAEQAGGVATVIAKAHAEGKFAFLPSLDAIDMLGWVVKFSVWTDMSKAFAPVSKAYKGMSGMTSAILTYVFLLGLTTIGILGMGGNVKKYVIGFTVIYW